MGSDALRFMMISRDANHTNDFDFKLVQEKSQEDNPVFYVQLNAHARCKSLIKFSEENLNFKTEKNIKYSEKLELDEELRFN